jgi:hypothetical protein
MLQRRWSGQALSGGDPTFVRLVGDTGRCSNEGLAVVCTGDRGAWTSLERTRGVVQAAHRLFWVSVLRGGS